jgi:hypothetical protein
MNEVFKYCQEQQRFDIISKLNLYINDIETFSKFINECYCAKK